MSISANSSENLERLEFVTLHVSHLVYLFIKLGFSAVYASHIELSIHELLAKKEDPGIRFDFWGQSLIVPHWEKNSGLGNELLPQIAEYFYQDQTIKWRSRKRIQSQIAEIQMVRTYSLFLRHGKKKHFCQGPVAGTRRDGGREKK